MQFQFGLYMATVEPFITIVSGAYIQEIFSLRQDGGFCCSLLGFTVNACMQIYCGTCQV